MTVAPRRVLLVEDSPVLRRLFALWCEQADCAVTAVAGRRAAEALLAGIAPDAAPELVIADFELGDGAADQLFACCAAPVIVCSGHARRPLPGHEQRLAAWLRKPVSRADFVAALDAALGRGVPSVSARDVALHAAYETERGAELRALADDIGAGQLDAARRRAHRFAGVAAVFRDETVAALVRRVETAADAGAARLALADLLACADAPAVGRADSLEDSQ